MVMMCMPTSMLSYMTSSSLAFIPGSFSCSVCSEESPVFEVLSEVVAVSHFFDTRPRVV